MEPLKLVKRGHAVFIHLPHGSDAKVTKEALPRQYREALLTKGEYTVNRGDNDNLCLSTGIRVNSLFFNALRLVRQEIEGAKFNGEHDPETGEPLTPTYLQRLQEENQDQHREYVERVTGKKQSKKVRTSLPHNRCPFCKNETDTKPCCATCNKEMFATCSKCVALGAPSIRAPRRMSEVITKEGTALLCFPHCVRSLAYRCQQCSKWHEKDMIHAFIRQEGNINRCLCRTCADSNHLTVCTSCHAVINAESNMCDDQGFKCSRCFSRNNGIAVKQKQFKLITKSKRVTRTFGLELEINELKRGKWLVREIEKLNVDGVEFSTVTDGSVYSGIEIVSFPTERLILCKAMKQVCKIVRRFPHTYDGCGIHVHIKDDGVKPLQVLRTWSALESLTMSLVPYFRKSNQYCRPISRNVNFDQVLRAKNDEEAKEMQGNRYCALNFQALSKYGTIEVRILHATTEYKDIHHFLAYLDTMWRIARKNYNDDTLKEFRGLADMAATGNTEAWRMLGLKMKLSPSTLNHLIATTEHYRNNRYGSAREMPRTFEPDRNMERTQRRMSSAEWQRLRLAESDIAINPFTIRPSHIGISEDDEPVRRIDGELTPPNRPRYHIIDSPTISRIGNRYASADMIREGETFTDDNNRGYTLRQLEDGRISVQSTPSMQRQRVNYGFSTTPNIPF